MSMLAGPRRKQKWSLNPRGKDWSEDQNKFGQKMLEKMGWSVGKGLGVKEQGITEHVRVRVKNDQVGIGYAKEKDDGWIECQDDYNLFLQNLHKQQTEFVDDVEIIEKSLSGKSLEEKSKLSSARVHYQKFTRGKDVNKYSKKDLANIFGVKDLSETQKSKVQELKQDDYDPIGTKNNTSGFVTVKGGNMNDYFQNKLNFSQNSRNEESKYKSNSDSESENHLGFGFSLTNVKVDKSSDYVFDNPCLNISASEESPIKLERLKIERDGYDNCAFDNPCLDTSVEFNGKVIYENALGDEFPKVDIALQKQYNENADVKNKIKLKKKGKRKRIEAENKANNDLDLQDSIKSTSNSIEQDDNDCEKTHTKKSKKKNKFENVFENPCLNISAEDELSLEVSSEKVQLDFGFVNKGLVLESAERTTIFHDGEIQNSVKKKKSKKNKNIGIDNPCLDMDILDEQMNTSRKRKSNSPVCSSNIKMEHCIKKRKSDGITNEGLDLSDSIKMENVSNNLNNFEVKRNGCIGLQNNGLDLVDEENEKHVVFNSTVEYSNGISKSKKKKKIKLDKYEVVSDKLKKKYAKKVVDVEINGLVNEGLNIECINIEDEENEVNDRKISKKKKKRDRRMSILETIEEVPEEEENCNNFIEILKDEPKGNKENKDHLTLHEFLTESPTEIELSNCTPKNLKKSKQKENISENIVCIDLEYENERREKTDSSIIKKKKKKKKAKDEEVVVVASETEEAKNVKKINTEKRTLPESSCKELVDDELTLEEFIKEEISHEIHKKEDNSKIKNLANKEKSEGPSTFKKSKMVMKALFNKNPTLLFNGSNINEIKGYGSQFYN